VSNFPIPTNTSWGLDTRLWSPQFGYIPEQLRLQRSDNVESEKSTTMTGSYECRSLSYVLLFELVINSCSSVSQAKVVRLSSKHVTTVGK